MTLTPKITDNRLYQLLRMGSVQDFNTARSAGETVDLRGTDLRGLDLKGLDTTGLDFTDCYFRQADLRGLDFTACRMEGASIHSAHIGGTYFPRELTADEITMSLNYGTRMRYNCG
jgi:uncharacterized protein YjbI with pentapeptide repeats